MDLFCYLCFVFGILSCLFIEALWLPAGKRANHLALLYEMFSFALVTFPSGVLGQEWY